MQELRQGQQPRLNLVQAENEEDGGESNDTKSNGDPRKRGKQE